MASHQVGDRIRMATAVRSAGACARAVDDQISVATAVQSAGASTRSVSDRINVMTHVAVGLPASLGVSGRLAAREVVDVERLRAAGGLNGAAGGATGGGRTINYPPPAEGRVIEHVTWYLVCMEAGERVVVQLAHTSSATTFVLGSAAGLTIAEIIWRYERRR